MDTYRLLVHPVRARIISTLAGREITRKEIEELIPEVPSPSLYRNLRVLLDAGIARTVRKIPRRGAEEHVYGLAEGGARVSPEEIEAWTGADRQRGLDTFLHQLSASYRAYQADGGEKACPARSRALHLTGEELDALLEEVMALFARYAALPPAEGRDRWIVATVFQPDERKPASTLKTDDNEP